MRRPRAPSSAQRASRWTGELIDLITEWLQRLHPTVVRTFGKRSLLARMVEGALASQDVARVQSAARACDQPEVRVQLEGA